MRAARKSAAARPAETNRHIEPQFPVLARASGLTQEPLAEKAEITTRYLQQLEAAEFGASLAVLIRLRRALGCRWDTLLEKIE
jgi:transcriptional regulator with XRE-family HTH domain